MLLVNQVIFDIKADSQFDLDRAQPPVVMLTKSSVLKAVPRQRSNLPAALLQFLSARVRVNGSAFGRINATFGDKPLAICIERIKVSYSVLHG